MKKLIQNMKESESLKKTQYKSAIRSKEFIQNAYLELLAENEEKKGSIRVVDIVKKAGINRGTFYSHYSSIEEVEADAAKHLSENILESIINVPLKELFDDPLSNIKLVISIIKDNIIFFKKIEKTRYADHYISQSISEFVRKAKTDSSLKEIRKNVGDPALFEFMIYTVLEGLIGCLRECLNGNINVSIDDFPEYVELSLQKLLNYIKYVMDFEELIPISGEPDAFEDFDI